MRHQRYLLRHNLERAGASGRHIAGEERGLEWNSEYINLGQIWGERPSELAIAAVENSQRGELGRRKLSILDIGCGYGRDALYLSSKLRCQISVPQLYRAEER